MNEMAADTGPMPHTSGHLSRFLLQTLLASLVSGAVIAAIGGAWIKGRMDQQFLEFQSTHVWKEKCLSVLLGPMVMQLDRCQRAFDRWSEKNIYLEQKIIRVGNETIRDLLLTHGYLIPDDLMGDAGRLIEHYDRWLEEFDKVRGGAEPDLQQEFVFVGPKGFPFPKDAGTRFRERFRSMWKEVYGKGVQDTP